MTIHHRILLTVSGGKWADGPNRLHNEFVNHCQILKEDLQGG